MTLIVDAGPIIAASRRTDPLFEPVRKVLLEERGELILSCLIVSEIDYLLSARGPAGSSDAFRHDLARGRFTVACLEGADFETIAELAQKYADLNPGAADLSLVVLAARYNTTRLLTIDQRHFRAIRDLSGKPFTLLPSDR